MEGGSGPGVPLLKPGECRLCQTKPCLWHRAKGPWAHGWPPGRGAARSHGTGSARCPQVQSCCLLCLLPNVYLCSVPTSCFSSPKGGQRRCPHTLCEEAQLNERHWKEGEPLLSGEQSHRCW